MMYFAHLLSYNKPKNALQRQALGVLKAHSGCLIDDADALISEIDEDILTLNSFNPRCSPLRLHKWETEDGIGLGLGDDFTVHFHLYVVKEAA